MVTCNLCGGLGNQLFQIFTTIAYALTNKTSFYFLDQDELFNGSVTRYTYWNSFLNALNPFLKPIHHYELVLSEYNFRYRELPSCTPNGLILLYGYFQSYKYFESYKHSIYKLLKINSKKTELMNRMTTTTTECNNIISMHFRLGDYKNYQNIYYILDEKYYISALHKILSLRTNPLIKVLYFCEEDIVEEVENIISKLKESFPSVTFEMANPSLEDWEQMLLMSLCKYNIIANSTFSWWGAYLNTNEDKVVCCPSKWFMPQTNKDISDLYPEDWIKVPF